MRTILVTGASNGIGFETVKLLAAESTNQVIAISRDLSQLQKLHEYCESEYKNKIHIYKVDFLSSNLEEELNTIIKSFDNHIDVLINNAGMLEHVPFDQTEEKTANQIFQVNYHAPVKLIQLAIQNADPDKVMHVVNIGSMGGFQGSVKFPGLSAYSSSKAALANLTECLAEEYKSSKIIFNCLALGSVQTKMLEKAFPGYEAQFSPQQVAEYIIDFAFNGWRYFNGKIIPVSKETP